MALELVKPGVWQTTPRLEEGFCAIGKGGIATFNASDLEAVGIKETCVMLIDRDGFRIALRPPRDGEQSFAVAARSPKKGKGGGLDLTRRRISIGSAIRGLGIDAKLSLGRIEFLTKPAEKLLTIPLTGAVQGQKGKGPR